MDVKEYEKKINLVNKYLYKKKLNIIFTCKLENFNEEYLYFGLLYHIKSRTYKVFFIDILKMESNNIIVARNGISKDYIDKDDINSLVTIESFITNYEYNKKIFQFKRYIPYCWQFLDEVIYILINNLPKRLFYIYQIMVEKLLKPEPNYLFAFDLKKEKIEKLFEVSDCLKGLDLYDNNKVKYLEKKGNIYYGIVHDSKKYLTKVIYDDEIKEMQLSCDCGQHNFCKHLFATLEMIRKGEEKRFYKVIKKDKRNKNVLEKIENLEYYLCLGVENNNLVIIDKDSLIKIPIDRYFDFEIVEDDNKKTLEKKINKILN